MKKKILYLVVLAILLTACSVSTRPTIVTQDEKSTYIEYEGFTVNGMPCLLFEYNNPGIDGYGFSVTCDWSKCDEYCQSELLSIKGK